MKRLLLTLTITLLSFVSFTQKISIDSWYQQTYSKYGKYEDNNIVLNSPDSIYERAFSPTLWEIDLEKRTLRGVGVNEPITIYDLQINKNGSVYVIDYIEEYKEEYGDGFLPITIFLDVSKNTMGFLYYWKGRSWLQQRENVKIN